LWCIPWRHTSIYDVGQQPASNNALERQAVAAINENLLILHATSSRPMVMRAIEIRGGVYAFPLWWLLFGRLRDAGLVTGGLTIWQVRRSKVRGVAGPRELGSPLFSYLLLVTIGILTLSTPLAIAFELESVETTGLDQIKQYLAGLVNSNPGTYKKTPASDLLNRLQRSKSFEQVVRSFGCD
jgi:hypothetical protein